MYRNTHTTPKINTLHSNPRVGNEKVSRLPNPIPYPDNLNLSISAFLLI